MLSAPDCSMLVPHPACSIQVETLQGLMKRRIGAHEYESAEWALAYLARDQGEALCMQRSTSGRNSAGFSISLA